MEDAGGWLAPRERSERQILCGSIAAPDPNPPPRESAHQTTRPPPPHPVSRLSCRSPRRCTPNTRRPAASPVEKRRGFASGIALAPVVAPPETENLPARIAVRPGGPGVLSNARRAIPALQLCRH